MRPHSVLRSAMAGVPPFGQSVLFGIAAGVVAGLLVLGPGLRLAMRAVAIQDPFRTPEFTIGGTMFIILFVGLIIGGALGLPGAIADRYLPRFVAAGLMTGLGMGFVMADPEIMEEFLQLGRGPSVNIPMFTLVFAGYSGTALWLVHRWLRQVASTSTKEKVTA